MQSFRRFGPALPGRCYGALNGLLANRHYTTNRVVSVIAGFANNHRPERNSPQVLGAGCGAMPNFPLS
jgi:hypothetical protein